MKGKQDKFRYYINIGLLIKGHKVFFGQRIWGDYFFGIKRQDRRLGHIFSCSGRTWFKVFIKFISVIATNRKVYIRNYNKYPSEENISTDMYVYERFSAFNEIREKLNGKPTK